MYLYIPYNNPIGDNGFINSFTQLARAVKYTDCTAAKR